MKGDGHSFRFRQFTVWQDHCAMKVGTDGTLLGAWACVPSSDASLSPLPSPPPCPRQVLDIGTGTGLIALMLAQRYADALVTGIDIDAAAASQASANASASPFSGRIAIRCGDVLTADLSAVSPFAAIVCNPPFFSHSLPSRDARRTLARHTSSLSFRQLMEVSRRLLATDGELSVIVPADGKALMESEAALAGFFKTRQCAVRTTPAKPPRRFMLAFRKKPAKTEASELVIGSEAYRALTKDFYL